MLQSDVGWLMQVKIELGDKTTRILFNKRIDIPYLAEMVVLLPLLVIEVTAKEGDGGLYFVLQMGIRESRLHPMCSSGVHHQ
jgi:hypothetical protein